MELILKSNAGRGNLKTIGECDLKEFMQSLMRYSSIYCFYVCRGPQIRTVTTWKVYRASIILVK
jgi:hypothetical protein